MSLEIFRNGQFGSVRVVVLDGEPWFVAKDVCDCLDLTDVSASCSRLDGDERLIVMRSELPDIFSESSNAPTMTLISESGLYTLVLRSNKPEAKVFRKWVTAEVLPAIRKTGGYGIRTVEDMINNPDTAIQLLTQVKILRLQNEQLALERDTAIKTKAWIGSKREATAMATASKNARECERLREQMGDSKNWKSVAAIKWLKDFFDMTDRYKTAQVRQAVALKLKIICQELRLDRKKVEDSRWGQVWAYPIEVIDLFKTRILTDQNMLARYRKI